MLRKAYETPRLILRPLRPSDYKAWFDAWTNRLPPQSKWDQGAMVKSKCTKAIGMKKETLRKRYWFQDGEWTDQIIFVANPEDIGLKSKKPRLK